MLALYEKFRPATLDDVVGQDDVVKRLKVIRDRGNNDGKAVGCGESGFGGRVFWISGPSGSGKTTLARIIARDVADPYAIIEFDAQRLSLGDKDDGKVSLRELRGYCQFRPIGSKGWHAFICNEAHNLSSRVVSELQTVLEEPHVQRTSTWIFTTTTKGQQRLFDTKFDAQPFLSRAMMFELSPKGHELDFAMRVQQIAVSEGLDGRPLAEYIELVRHCNGNMRQCLNAVESGEMLV